MSGNKELQKVTDFESIKTKKSLREHLEKNPEDFNALSGFLFAKINSAFLEKDGTEALYEDLYVSLADWGKRPEVGEQVRNITYEGNYSLISAFIHNFIIKSGRFPTATEIQDGTGLSRTTIYRHLKLDDFGCFDKLIRGKHEIMAKRALEQLYFIGVQERNAGALKAFIELSGAFPKGNTTNINNYIQVNNLRISKEEFDQLPFDTVLEIEKLINKGLALAATIPNENLKKLEIQKGV